MNPTLRYVLKWLTVVTLGTILFTACQDEKVIVNLPPDGTTTSSDTAVAGLISQVSENDGSKDNILDGSSCVSIVLPVTIKVDGQTIVIDSLSDLSEVEEIIHNSGDDHIDFLFPVKVLLADHTEVTIDSENDLKDLTESCSGEDNIRCIDFNYPLQFNTYDSNNQVAGTVIINNDEELYKFFKHLKNDEIVGLKFPITLTKSNGDEIVVTTFDQLEETIKSASNDCKDDDGGSGGGDDSDFITILTQGKWSVDSFVDGGDDQTSDYSGYSFTFTADHSMTAEKQSDKIDGTWSTNVDGDKVKLEISLSSEALEDLSEDWTIAEFNADTIRMTRGGGRSLVLKKI